MSLINQDQKHRKLNWRQRLISAVCYNAHLVEENKKQVEKHKELVADTKKIVDDLRLAGGQS